MLGAPRGATGARSTARRQDEVRLLARLRAIGGWRRYALILSVDAILVGLAFWLGYLLRFEGDVPAARVAEFRRYVLLLVAIRIPLHLAFGIHRWSFRLSGFYEALRVVLATLTGSASFATIFYFLQRGAENLSIGPPRSVIAVEFFITSTLLGALRFSPRFAYNWSIDKRRARSGPSIRAVIAGAGSAGELLLRDLTRSDEHHYEVVGFVDDDPRRWWGSLGGRPVLGPLDSLPDVVQRRGVREVLFAIPRLPAGRLREVLALCEGVKLGYKILPVSFAYLNDRVSASMLHDLEPDHLLQRPPVAFDPQEIASLVSGRRLLITGAAGSIGSEICRQVAPHGPAALTLLDTNANDLYLLSRSLEQSFPGLRVAIEVADVRDRKRLLRVGREHRPQDVFHAAAQKQVPVMESLPEEAVMTNVVGCRNGVSMAEEVGAERFVLISTDKAVHPSSVMGATKAVAELIVRHAASSSDGYTAVRFGNVLGSAGSVVPLFKAQIAAGGPVTVTHRDCRRYLMTIREAVGLVLMSGLGVRGGLCILQMGEPIRILDLARLMITMAGYIPDEEIQVEFTGLRPGEKLDEELMTAEEEKSSHTLRDVIRVITSPPPASDVTELVTSLEALAMAGDRAGIVTALCSALPTFTPSPAWTAPLASR